MRGSINIIMLREIVARLENWPDRNQPEEEKKLCKLNSMTTG